MTASTITKKIAALKKERGRLMTDASRLKPSMLTLEIEALEERLHQRRKTAP